MKRNVARWGLVLVTVLANGCDEPSPPEVGTASLLERERQARCEFEARCGIAPDLDTCLASARPDDALVQSLGLVPFGRVRYNGEAANNYIEALTGRNCDSTLEARREFETMRADIFAGTIEFGGPCFGSDECTGDAVCDRTMCPNNQQCCTGVCVERRELMLGEPCPLVDESARLQVRCADDAYCARPDDVEDPQEGICTARVDNGQACDADQECLDGQRCSSEQTCFIQSSEGEMCNPLLGPAACRGFNETCLETRMCGPLPGPGAPCADGQCLGHAVCVEDVCQARPRLGEPCDELPCLGDLRCVDGFCALDPIQSVCLSGSPPPPPEPME